MVVSPLTGGSLKTTAGIGSNHQKHLSAFPPFHFRGLLFRRLDELADIQSVFGSLVDLTALSNLKELMDLIGDDHTESS